ncbi:hypothetical protein [Chloroflexus sp.]|uniref:hypothetical protein n=1 Tax=Chloroflexus sp. TaxID=1904827 RepID=UPI003C789E29
MHWANDTVALHDHEGFGAQGYRPGESKGRFYSDEVLISDLAPAQAALHQHKLCARKPTWWREEEPSPP